jgi:hypothetical protein
MERIMRSFPCFILVAIATLALETRAEGPAPKGAQGRAARAPRQMRTLKVDGGYIRYEVLPGDADEPPGQMTIVESDRSAGRRAAGSEATEQRAAAPEARTQQPPRDACRRERARLAVRLFELKGLDVPGDLALWLQEHPTFYAPDPLSLNNDGPTLAALIQSDWTAQGYAEDLVRCERAQARR